MKRLHKILIGLGVALLLLLASSAAVIQSHAHRIWGGYVEHADSTPFRIESALTAIVGVNLLANDGQSMIGPRTVVFQGNQILAVLEQEPPPEGALIFDGGGQFLIPGLIDAHVHLRRQPNDLLLYLANGITQVRDLSGSPSILDLKDQVDSGRAGPRITAASPMIFTTTRLNGWFREWTEPRLNVRSPDRAEAVVKQLSAEGYDLLKIYTDVDPGVFEAINRAARQAGIHTIGHLPFDFSLNQLAETELRELGHIEEIIKRLQDEFDPEIEGPYEQQFPRFVEDRSDPIIDDLLANDITVNTTLWLMEIIGKQAFDLRAELSRLPLEYANPAMVEGSPYVASVGWLPGRNLFEVKDDPGPEQRARIEASWEARAEAHRVLFKKMVARGVRLTAGTDATTHLMIPGFSLHAELESLVRNGMTPSESLRAATATAAEVMRSNAGVIAVGRAADLLLLSANPLDDIRNTTAIEAVVIQGRLFDRTRLDAMLDSVVRANASSRNFDLKTLQ